MHWVLFGEYFRRGGWAYLLAFPWFLLVAPWYLVNTQGEISPVVAYFPYLPMFFLAGHLLEQLSESRPLRMLPISARQRADTVWLATVAFPLIPILAGSALGFGMIPPDKPELVLVLWDELIGIPFVWTATAGVSLLLPALPALQEGGRRPGIAKWMTLLWFLAFFGGTGIIVAWQFIPGAVWIAVAAGIVLPMIAHVVLPSVFIETPVDRAMPLAQGRGERRPAGRPRWIDRGPLNPFADAIVIYAKRAFFVIGLALLVVILESDSDKPSHAFEIVLFFGLSVALFADLSKGRGLPDFPQFRGDLRAFAALPISRGRLTWWCCGLAGIGLLPVAAAAAVPAVFLGAEAGGYLALLGGGYVLVVGGLTVATAVVLSNRISGWAVCGMAIGAMAYTWIVMSQNFIPYPGVMALTGSWLGAAGVIWTWKVLRSSSGPFQARRTG